MDIHDISLPLSNDLPSWPGDPRPRIKRIHNISEGDDSNVTHLSMTAHTGTHIDAPDHFLDSGETLDQIPLGLFIGPAQVVELPSGRDITADMIQEADIPAYTKRILFKTRNSQLWQQGVKEFQKDFMALDEKAAEYLVSRDVEVVGVDYLSVAPFRAPKATHQILLEGKVLIIEGLDLSGIESGQYTLYCLPLNIPEAEGAPARVLLGR
ncbi:MAG: cyclase family protein [Anaerolineales bacterium]|nr:cyclase family protein [Anaerolineales bacterium]